MRELTNLYLSRSDSAITLRHDLKQNETDMDAIADELQGANYPEFLQGRYFAVQAGGYLYFSNLQPFSFENDETVGLSNIYKKGTITTDGTSSIVNGDSDTEWLKMAWAGCLIREKDDTRWYQVDEVKSDVYIVTTPAMHALTESEYEILRTHPMANGDWPMQFGKLGNLLVYNPTNPSYPVDKDRISGPFYSDVGRADIFGVWKEYEPELTVEIGEYYTVSGSAHYWPKYSAELGYINPLLVAGQNALMVTNEQWVGDYDSDDVKWENKKEEFFYIDYPGRLTYPRGNGYPVVEDYRVIPYGTDSPIVGIEWYGVNAGAFVLRNGSYATFSGEILPDRDEDERTDDGPWVPTTIDALISVIESPANGMYNGYIFGGDGQIRNYPAAALVTGVSSSINGACHGEDAAGGYAFVFVGGVDTGNATVLKGGTVRITTGVGSEELFDVCYMLAPEASPPGFGRFIAVGANGTVIYSDDGATTWSTVADSGTTEHLKTVMCDPQGRCVMAGGDNGTCIVSDDGEEWEELVVTNRNITDISFDSHRGAFVLITEGSHDPIRIKRRTKYGTNATVTCKRVGIISSDSRDRVFSVIWDGSQFIAGGNKIWTSPTGATWTQRSFPGGVAGDIACLAHDGAGTVIAVGKEGMILRSTDSGVSWSKIYGPGENGAILGPILSVIWDDYNFFCCGDDTILKSATGAAWASETFNFNEEPVLLAYNGLSATSAVSGRTYGFTDGNINVVCRSGNWYINQNDKSGGTPTYDAWTKWEDGPGTAGVFSPTKMQPGGLVAPRSYTRAICVDNSPGIANLWAMSDWGADGYWIRHQHLNGEVEGVSTGFLEPGDLHLPQAEEGTIENAGNLKGNYNTLLVLDQRDSKAMATPVILWKHNSGLMVSCDGGETWSKNANIVVPTKGGSYVTPITEQPRAGELCSGFVGSDFDTSKVMSAMVTDGTDGFLATPFSPEGVVFVNMTWDGLNTSYFDKDEVPPVPEVVVQSTAGEGIVLTPGTCSIS